MNRSQFLRDLRRYCRKNGLDPPGFNARHGKGSHGRVQVGDRFTTVPDGEINPYTLRAILAQLGLPPDAF